jgi:hypothetical protein
VKSRLHDPRVEDGPERFRCKPSPLALHHSHLHTALGNAGGLDSGGWKLEIGDNECVLRSPRHGAED